MSHFINCRNVAAAVGCRVVCFATIVDRCSSCDCHWRTKDIPWKHAAAIEAADTRCAARCNPVERRDSRIDGTSDQWVHGATTNPKNFCSGLHWIPVDGSDRRALHPEPKERPKTGIVALVPLDIQYEVVHHWETTVRRCLPPSHNRTGPTLAATKHRRRNPPTSSNHRPTIESTR
jgi:hypothetical protein